MHGYTYDERSGTLLPDPARHKPKPGHWRVTPRGKMRAPHGETVLAGPVWKSNMDGVATDFRSKRRPTRAELRMRIAAGDLPASAMPKRGGKRA